MCTQKTKKCVNVIPNQPLGSSYTESKHKDKQKKKGKKWKIKKEQERQRDRQREKTDMGASKHTNS